MKIQMQTEVSRYNRRIQYKSAYDCAFIMPWLAGLKLRIISSLICLRLELSGFIYVFCGTVGGHILTVNHTTGLIRGWFSLF